jgi:hypothetical protein
MVKGLLHSLEARAFDAIKDNGLTRLVKSQNFYGIAHQKVILGLIQKILSHGKKHIDVPSLVSLALSSNAPIS